MKKSLESFQQNAYNLWFTICTISPHKTDNPVRIFYGNIKFYQTAGLCWQLYKHVLLKSELREDSSLPPVSWRELQTQNCWSPLKSTFSEGVGSALWDLFLFPAAWWAAEPVLGSSEVSWSLQCHGKWESATSIVSESWSSYSDLLQISLYPFGRVLILKVKMIALNISLNCIPSYQRTFERNGMVGLNRSMQGPVGVTSWWCWAGFRCGDAEVVLPALPSPELFPPARGSSEPLCVRQGQPALLHLCTLPTEITRLYSICSIRWTQFLFW